MSATPIKATKKELENAIKMWETYAYMCKVDVVLPSFPAWAKELLNTLEADTSDVSTTEARVLDLFNYTDFLYQVIWTEYGAAEAVTVPEARALLGELNRRLSKTHPDRSYFNNIEESTARKIRLELKRFLRK